MDNINNSEASDGTNEKRMGNRCPIEIECNKCGRQSKEKAKAATLLHALCALSLLSYSNARRSFWVPGDVVMVYYYKT